MYQHARRLHMMACLVRYVIRTAGTLAEPEMIDWSQARVDNGICASCSLWRNKSYRRFMSSETLTLIQTDSLQWGLHWNRSLCSKVYYSNLDLVPIISHIACLPDIIWLMWIIPSRMAEFNRYEIIILHQQDFFIQAKLKESLRTIKGVEVWRNLRMIWEILQSFFFDRSEDVQGGPDSASGTSAGCQVDLLRSEEAWTGMANHSYLNMFVVLPRHLTEIRDNQELQEKQMRD